MKILFLSRIDLFKYKGGDTFQMLNTKKELEALNKNIQIDISTELNIKNIHEYDIIHVFNIDWVCETYTYAKQAKDNNKKLVLSAIHHSEQEVLSYEQNSRYDFRRLVNPIITSQALRDELKNIYRCFTTPEKIIPTIWQILRGIRNQQRDVLKMADVVLVQTISEAHDLKKDFGVWDFKYKVVYNAVDIENFVKATPDFFMKEFYKKNKLDPKINKVILNVGRIEARKNQLKLIEAFNKLKQNNKFKDYVLVFIGAMNNHHPEYIYRFKNNINSKNGIYYLGEQNQKFVASAMSAGEIYVQPSYFETTGLVTLEAISAGMKIVAAGERIKEYLQNDAIYCDINNSDSIMDAIIKARDLKSNKAIIKEIKMKYNWHSVAVQTLKAYESL